MWIWDNAVPLQPYDPEKFFAQNRSTLTYLGGMKWSIHDSNGETIDHMVEIDVSGLETFW